ncbi:tubulin-specific chaperone D [Entomortierella parvispora]|uniref:Tubulin-specific chaperone D n=1 Tax=Entomortierella parvispora TaxID=205924 RepID=A0A9P3HDH1_9FUNG|nr:tubulin-specific chaperone D [Entomortierella parvispora]
MADDNEPYNMDAVLDGIEDQEGDLHLTSKTVSHFYHERVVLEEIKNLASYPLIGPSPLDNRERWGLRISLIRYIGGYQYQSYLLDRSLEAMITPLITPIRKLVYDLTIGDLQGQSMNEMGDEVFYMLYFITKTRGYKTVLKFLPHEVQDLEPAFAFLKAQDKRRPWETRYMLMLWLSLMCMIPFDLRSIDSEATKTSERIPLVDSMIETGKSYLDRAGKDRDGSALLLARLLTRKDTCTLYLPEFVDWAQKTLASEPTVFLAVGILATLCWIFKLGQREVLLPIAESMEEMLSSIESKDQFMLNSSAKQYIIKLSQRVGLCLLKPRVAAWRYQRGNRSLLSNLNPGALQGSQVNKMSTTIIEETEDDENFEVPEAVENVIERLMNGLRDRDTIVRWSAAKGMGRMSNRLPKDMADDVVGGIFELFSEDVFQLPNGEPDISSVSEHTWHGACLAIAELSRRGLLLPHRLTELIPWIILALKFDVKRGAHSVGSNVRDSSCYVCWSFARAYTPEVLDEHVRKLSNTLVAVSVFDRDINIRRASSAAFQENVGRMGIFPHGIDIVTVADFMSVGQINNSFLTVAPYIAGFPEYRRNLTQHLLESVITHWDIAVREVASESMARIAVLDLEFACTEIIPSLTKMTSSLDPTIRHGALIALGRTCKAVKAHSETPLEQRLSAETLQGIAQVVPNIPEYTLSGFGSEHIRQALCVYISSLSEAGWSVEGSVLASWKAIIESTLERIEEPLQKLASETFKALVAQYGISGSEIEHCIQKVSPGAERFGQRGFALALGEIDFRVPQNSPWVSKVVAALVKNASTNLVNEAVADAESRRNSLLAVTNIINVLDDFYRRVISKEVSTQILDVYYSGLQDYSIDHRGDVGSWSREASMQGLQTMLPLVARLDLVEENKYLSDEDHAQLLAKLLQQSVEKIDRIRACAATAITKIVYAKGSSSQGEPENYLLRIPHREKIMSVIDNSADLNWLQPAQVYPRVVQLLNLKEYRTDLLLGFIVSAGGLTESLVRHSSACLSEFVTDLPITSDGMDGNQSNSTLTMVEFGNEIMTIVEKYEGQDRVIVPLLEVLDMLVESGALLMMEGEYDFAPMVRFVRRQTLKCKDTRKLSACVRLFCGLCGLGGKIKNAILIELLRLLVHPFPKVRRTTADSMYLMLTGSIEDPTPESEQVGQILVNSDWNFPVAQLTPLRDQIYPLLGLQKPKPVAPPVGAQRRL